MKKKSVVLTKINLKIANLMSVDCLFTPKFESGIEAVKTINGDVEADLWQYRNLEFHCKLFAICNEYIDNDFFIKLIQCFKEVQETFNIIVNLSDNALQAIRAKFKDDTYSFIYICKYFFLPLDDVLLPNGRTVNIISSIAFKSMDNLEFTKFYDNVIDLIAFVKRYPRGVIEKSYATNK